MSKQVHGRTPKKPPRKGPLDASTFATAIFACPDAYADVPGSVFDTVARAGAMIGTAQGAKTLGFLFAATVFGVTAKVQGSMNGVNYVDLTTADQAGVARVIDVAIAAGAFANCVLTPNLAAGAAGGGFRFYKVQARNTVGLSVGSVVVTVVGKQ